MTIVPLAPLKNKDVLADVVCFACNNIGTFKQIPRYWDDNGAVVEFHNGHYFCTECGMRHYIEPCSPTTPEKPKEYA